MPEPTAHTARCIVALAGRLIDVPGSAEARFPAANVPRVQRDLHTLLAKLNPAAIVCSAACGADLIALEAAARLGVAPHVVLPFGVERFLRTSVDRCPG